MSYKLTDTLPLPNSTVRIPRLGFGVYRSPPSQCVQSVKKALEVGYRHIDTAQFYANESEVGEALRASGIPRDQVFVTTKILSPAGSAEQTYDKLVASVEKIGGPGGYVDLFLIHSPSSGPAGRKQLWQALEKLHAEGRAKAIGVSNYGVQHIEEMKKYAQVWPPHVNQIEVCPFLIFVLCVNPICEKVSTEVYANWCALRYSSTLGVSNALSTHTASSMASSSKLTRPSYATTKPMTRLSLRSLRSTTAPRSRS